MQRRIDENIAVVERNANKMARVSNRSNPLMEMLGGFAVAGCLLYGGYSVVALGATPGQFFSFMTAFLLATEPAKRLARLNIDLNSQSGRRAHAARDRRQPGERACRRRQAGAETLDAQVEFRDVNFAYRPDEPVLNAHELRRRARQDHRAGRPLRRRQVDRAGAVAAALRGRTTATS